MTMLSTAGGMARPLDAPLRDVLGRVAYELHHLSAGLRHVETLVGPLALAAGPLDGNIARDIQDLDHIRQKVDGIADFLAALMPVATDDCLVNARAAARRVTLADLAARLALSDTGAERADWGDCELF